MHKIPATLGLGTFLNHMKLKVGEVFLHILAFTLTSPICSITAFYLLKLSKLEEAAKQDLGLWVGMLLLVSSGTFLYVATIQILPDIFNNKEKQSQEAKLSGRQRATNRFMELILIIFGMISPIIFKMLVGHED